MNSEVRFYPAWNTPQAMRPPLLPEGSVRRSSALACTTIALPSASSSPALFERVSFSFNKISVQYTPQAQDGSAQGVTSFDDEWAPAG